MSEAPPPSASPLSPRDFAPPLPPLSPTPPAAPVSPGVPRDPAHAAAEEVLAPISADIMRLLHVADGRPLSVQQIAEQLQERGWALLTLVLAAPFPIPSIPGLSVPFGIAIAFIGWGFLFRTKPRLPQFVMKRKLSYGVLQKVVPFISRLMQRVERWTKPRLRWLASGPVMISFIGLGLVSGGLFLAIPIPIPLTNTLPAISTIFLVVGMLCRDGLMVLIGYFLGLLGWIYLGVWIYFLQAYLWPWVAPAWNWIKNLF